MVPMQSRRELVASLAGLGVAGLLPGRSALADEPPPETGRIRSDLFAAVGGKPDIKAANLGIPGCEPDHEAAGMYLRDRYGTDHPLLATLACERRQATWHR